MSEPYKTTVTIDGQSVTLAIARLSLSEAIPFRTKFRQTAERSKRTDHMKIMAETDEEYDRILAREVQEEEAAAAFIAESIRRYVSVPEETDLRDAGERLRTGEDLLRAYGARQGVLTQLLSAIFVENVLGESEKKALRSALASSPGSAAPNEAPNGARPETIAPSASSSGTTENGDVTGDPATKPSGPKVH